MTWNNNKGRESAIKLFNKYGINNLMDDFSLDYLVYGLGTTLIYKELTNCDGRIIFGKKNTLIEINSNIEFEQKKRFTIAHELGHFIMHKGMSIHNDNENTTSWFNNKENQAKNGLLEYEANQFASEILMPTSLFIKKQKGKKFSPDLLRELANYFNVSITSVAFKYFEFGNHPICLFHCYNNVVKYWKWPKGYPHYIVDRTKLAPPDDSVASEFFEDGTIYSKANSKQQIWKSTWFELKSYENDNDFKFYEYCIITPKYKNVLSVVWEEL